MRCEHAAHNIFIYVDAEVVSDLLGDARIAEHGIAPSHFNNGCDKLCTGAFRSRISWMPRGREEHAVLSIDQSLVELDYVAALVMAESLGMRYGLTKPVVGPSTKRSSVVRFGARCRERLLLVFEQ